MVTRLVGLVILVTANGAAQSVCPAIAFVQAPQAMLKPTATSHLDVVRQSDGSYTAFEVGDAAPYRVIQATPHFERQIAACTPHALPATPSLVAPVANPKGAGSQVQASMAVGANLFVAHFSADQTTLLFDLFDAQHNLISERQFAPPGSSPAFQSVALADLNGDGKLDLIAAVQTYSSAPVNAKSPPGTYTGNLWTLLGNGDGTFQEGNPYTPLVSGSPISGMAFAVGDLNGDGFADVAVAGPGVASVIVMLGHGDGTLRSLSAPPLVIANCNVSSVALADLNGDGKLDVVAGCATMTAIALGNGDGTFQKPSVYPSVQGGYQTAAAAAMVAVGDVNGDGVPDVVTSGGTILYGDGKGGVASRADYAPNLPGTSFSSLSPTGGPSPVLLATSVTIGDFDGDGKPDLIFGTGNAGYLSGTAVFPAISVLFGAGGGNFVGAPVSGTPIPLGGLSYSGPLPPPYATIALADFSADGVPEVAVASVNLTQTTSSVLVDVYRSSGAGKFTTLSQQTFPLSQPYYLRATVAGDFNHDGKPDLAVLLSGAPTDSEIQIYLGNGDGTFGAPIMTNYPNPNLLFLTEADLNADGISDLLVGSQGNPLVFLGKGDGTFQAPLTVSAGYNNPAMVLGDFNGDGKTDMAVTGELTGSVSVLLGNGDGTFGKPIASALPSTASGFNGQIAAADFNGDGKLDLAVTLGSGQFPDGPTQTAILMGNGDGTFGRTLSSPGMESIVAADFNGDGIPDLIGLVSPATPFPSAQGVLSVRLGNGDGTFQSDQPIVGDSALFAVSDLNGDGLPDVVDFYYEGLMALINDSQPAAPLTVVSAASYAAGPLSPGSIAAAFGAGFLAKGQSVSATLPLPFEIAGVGVTVTDSLGVSRPAQLYFVSSSQIDFVVPAGTDTGKATVAVTGAASGKALSGAVQIAALAPALFTVGNGIAAATAVRVAPGGAQTQLAVFAGGTGGYMTVPIDLSQPGSVYLTLYGTGFEGLPFAGLSATLQGIGVTITYAGTQGTYPGLDQINVQLPASLAGWGVASVEIVVGGVSANPAVIAIQ